MKKIITFCILCIIFVTFGCKRSYYDKKEVNTFTLSMKYNVLRWTEANLDDFLMYEIYRSNTPIEVYEWNQPLQAELIFTTGEKSLTQFEDLTNFNSKRTYYRVVAVTKTNRIVSNLFTSQFKIHIDSNGFNAANFLPDIHKVLLHLFASTNGYNLMNDSLQSPLDWPSQDHVGVSVYSKAQNRYFFAYVDNLNELKTFDLLHTNVVINLPQPTSEIQNRWMTERNGVIYFITQNTSTITAYDFDARTEILTLAIPDNAGINYLFQNFSKTFLYCAHSHVDRVSRYRFENNGSLILDTTMNVNLRGINSLDKIAVSPNGNSFVFDLRTVVDKNLNNQFTLEDPIAGFFPGNVHFSNSGRYIFRFGTNGQNVGKLVQYNASTGKLIHTYTIPNTSPITPISYLFEYENRICVLINRQDNLFFPFELTSLIQFPIDDE